MDSSLLFERNEVSAKVVPCRLTFFLLQSINSPTSFNKMQNSNLTCISLGPKCPQIHSLLLADDLILCGNASVAEATTIHRIFQEFSIASDQIPLFQESTTLSARVDNNTKDQIKSIFSVPDLLPNTMHLGYPMIFNHKDRTKPYEFIINKFRAKLTIVKENMLNHARRLTYIQPVLAFIPMFYISTVLFSQPSLESIDTIIILVDMCPR